ncbi:MAG: HAMP domain-containing sensor histidine kinase [Gelidibacter sp.]
MKRRLFIMLVVLMSLSLIGIIFVQVYFINNSLKNEEKQFTLNVKRTISYVSKSVEDDEIDKYYDAGIYKLNEYVKNGGKADTTFIKQLSINKQDDNTNQTIVYTNGILEESYKIPSMFFDISLDSINLNRISQRKETTVYDKNPIDGSLSISPEKRLVTFNEMDDVAKSLFKDFIKDQLSYLPIYKRISVEELKKRLALKLNNEGIDIDFQFAIYDKDLATKVQSDNFEKNVETTYGVPIFADDSSTNKYLLYIDFPNRNKFLLSSILGMMILSILFTAIIIIAYTSALYQLVKQRQISQIKTDFINNMTHEFKTPIATINLALDAIKNPKIVDDKEKVARYLKMIKDENKRMHAQVENVLRISKLEKNELNISKERVKLHDLIEDAITHVELIVEDRQGYVKSHLNADKSSVLANDTHFTNVIVNILDNAIKYSDDAPKIDVTTENVGNNIILKIADQGNGMSKQVQKRVFEKFYREHTGNVHNVKGHGLGLAYVKRIVEDHQGHVSVESEKGKGSTFIIKLPLIS